MNPAMVQVFSLLGLCVALFVWGKPRSDVVAILAIIALSLSGVVTVPEALAGFSDPNILLIAALFVVGEGLVRTGIAVKMGSFLQKRAAGSEGRLIAFLMVAVAVLGSVMSSTGVVAIFIPVGLLVAERLRISPGRLMMPLSFGGLISGMLTLVGTAPNLVADSALRNAGLPGFGFFDFTPFGLVILVAGVGYMLMARRWLKGRREPEGGNKRRRLADFIRDYDLADRERRVRVLENSPAVGMSLRDLDARREAGANVVAVERRNNRRPEILEPRAELVLQARDVLLIDALPLGISRRDELLAKWKAELLPLRGDYFLDMSQEIGMAEVLVPPDSELVGQTIIDATFRTRYRLNVIGLRRGSKAVKSGLLEQKLRAGDALLVIGRWKQIRDLRTEKRDLLVLSLPAEMDQVTPARHQAPFAVAILGLMVTLMVTGAVPNVIAALLACVLMGLARCVKLEGAYKAIQWPSLILIAGMIPFSTALQKTGGADLIADGLLHLFGDASPRLLLGALFVVTALIGLFVSNTATAVLMAPIAITVAKAASVSPYPFVMTVALASSAAFMTPVSSPVNTLVFVPGKYQFGDFVRIGVPFTILVLIITLLMVPWLMPFHR